jgi:hypothetical protein
MRKLLLLIVAILAISLATKAQMAAAKEVAPILSCSQVTDMSVQRAYTAVCDVRKYVKLSGGLITNVSKVEKSDAIIIVTLSSGEKYTFSLTPNTNYNTLSFSIVSPKEYEEIGFIIIVDEARDGTKISIAASGNVSPSVRDEAKKVMEPIFMAMLNGFKEIE